jgi:glycosyltransferase involved in cell wall biosynthesis/SAM-dependent methyltransferase
MITYEEHIEQSVVSRKAAIFNQIAPQRDAWKKRNRYYYQQLEAICKRYVKPGSKVLELGCGTSDLLAALEPVQGLGIDLSKGMIAQAQRKYPQYQYIVGDATAVPLDQVFDYIVMSDLIGHLDDIWVSLDQAHRIMHPDSRLVLTYYNFAWEGILRIGERIGWKTPQDHQNWLGMSDIENLLNLTNFEVETANTEVLLPIDIPVISDVVNNTLAQTRLLRWACLIQYFVARPVSLPHKRSFSVSVIIPCRNEIGNIADAIQRMPEMGTHTEIIFVDGASTDGTVEEIERVIEEYDGVKDIKLIHQVTANEQAVSVAGGTAEQPKMLKLGKGDAVRKGFDAAQGDVLMILDADLTVPPEDLPKFYEPLAEGKGTFINGTRLIYPMEDEAMPMMNYFGNKLFSWIFTWLLEQRIKDTLCGTKVLLKGDYERIKAGRSYFGDFDPFGDFDLLFGGARQQLKIIEVPVRYRRRRSGYSKVTAYRHGWLLLRMCAIAFGRLKLPKLLGITR